MKVLIDIPEEDYKRCTVMASDIRNGIVLDGLTNGEVMIKTYNVDADDVKIGVYYVNVFLDEKIVTFNLDWWNRKWGE